MKVRQGGDSLGEKESQGHIRIDRRSRRRNGRGKWKCGSKYVGRSVEMSGRKRAGVDGGSKEKVNFNLTWGKKIMG